MMTIGTSPARRLISIDMLRGVAALGVMLYHAFGGGIFQRPAAALPLSKAIVLLPASYGYAGVYLFFVISGFCIHLKWAKAKAAGNNEYVVAFIPFWKRRIRRLYPAYLAALILYLGVVYYNGDLKLTSFLAWDVVSHLLLIHNFSPSTVFSLNGVFWTLAVEEQLYLAYFLLLHLRVRYGWKTTILLCALMRVLWFGIGFGIHRQFGIEIVVAESAASNWLVWALGAISVEWLTGLIVLPQWLRSPLLAALALAASMGLAYVDHLSNPVGNFHHVMWLILTPSWGVGFFLGVNAFVAAEPRWSALYGKTNIIAWLTGLGLISYSLYLTHELIFHLAPAHQPIAVPLCIVLAWIFFHVFEKPFLPAPLHADAQQPQSTEILSRTAK